MAGLNDMIRSAFPGGNVAKPLMLALGALLASGVLNQRQRRTDRQRGFATDNGHE